MCDYHDSYITAIFDPIKLMALAQEFAITIADDLNRKMTIDTIVVRGISGIAMGAVVSALTQIPLTIVRKTTDNSHAEHLVEFGIHPEKIHNYIIIDDIIHTGDTVDKIITEMQSHCPSSKLKLRKIYLYEYCSNQGMDKFDLPIELVYTDRPNKLYNMRYEVD